MLDAYLQKCSKTSSIEDLVLELIKNLKFLTNMIRSGGDYENPIQNILDLITDSGLP